MNIIHALSPFKPCPFDCPFCCAKENETNKFTSLSWDYWQNTEKVIQQGGYRNLMLTGDTEPTLFPLWVNSINLLAHKYNIVTELRTHNYSFNGTLLDEKLNQVWYSITDAAMVKELSSLVGKGLTFAEEVNFAFLINKDFSAEDILIMRKRLPRSKFTVRYLMNACGSVAITNWVNENYHEFTPEQERALMENDIRVGKIDPEEVDILRQDGKIYHSWQ